MIAKQIIDEAIASDILLFTEAGKLGFKQKSAAPFPEALKKQIQAHKADIIAFLANQYNDLDIPLRSADKTRLPLSNAQQRLWFIDSLKQGSAEYNQPLAFTVSGQPDLAKIETVLSTIVARHEILRTTYHQDDIGAYQQVNASRPCHVQVHDLTALDDWQSEITKIIAAESAKCFDLSTDLMLRVDYFKAPATERENGILLFNTHHIASDGWSQQILMREFVTLYAQLNADQPAQLAPLEIQYGDFALWQQQRAENGALSDALSYWQQQLADAPLVHDLPLCQTRPATKQHAGGHVHGQLGSEIAQPLLALALRLQVTPFMLMHALLSLLLSRYSNSADIVIGTPVANRVSPQLDELIGFFVNTLPLRVDTSQQDLYELVAHVKEVHLAAQQHQQVQFDQLVEHLNIPRSTQYAPLCQIMLTTASEFGINESRDMLASALASDGLTLAPYGVERVVARFDIDTHINISDAGIELDWMYDSSIFSHAFITRLNQNFAALLCQVSAQGEKNLPLRDIPALCESERQQLLTAGEQQRLDYDSSRCIHQLFEQQAAATPEATALVFQDQFISYETLNLRANQLAHYLLSEQHVTPETLIGVCSSRSLEMIVSMLAILKAGGAYVPLDPDYPASRLSYMAADAGLKQVIGFGSGLSVAEALMREQAGSAIDIATLALDDYPQHNPALDDISSDSLAYVIYTSGSTGQPKGVQLIHQGAVNLAHNQQARFGTCADSKVLQFASISFDAATWEWLMALSCGATLVIADESQRTDVEQLSALLKTQQITHATLPPALLSTMALQTDLALQCLIVAGEACEEAVVARWRAHYPFYNAYGPSETSVCATVGEITNDIVHIGTPLCNVQTYVLDKQQNLLPHGSLGELYVGGDGLARGYLNQSELTAERFVDNPFYDPEVAGSSRRLYRTGDLVRYLADGNLAFVGRADDQIKIRGFRVELGEIAQQLSRQAEIDSALVLAKNGPAGTYLVAYVQPVDAVAEQAQAAFMSEALATLAQSLPDYMVPKLGVVIAEWPLTANGKVNKKALPEADTSALQGCYVAPQGEREQLIVTLCGELLAQPVEQLSVTANFFTLGGHSLLLMQLASRLRQQGFEVDAQALFAAQTLQEMAQGLTLAMATEHDASGSLIPADCTLITPDMVPLAELDQAQLNDIAAEIPGGMANIQDIYPLAPLQEGVLFVHSMDPENDPYVTNYLYELKSDAALTEFTDSLNFLLARHDVLRTAILWQGRAQALQVVQREVTLPVTQLTCAAGMSAQQTITALADGPQWLDLAWAPLLRLQVCQDPDTGYHYALLQAHHLIIDHVAMAVIQDELHSYSMGEAHSLPAPASYRQFISDTLARMETLDIDGFFSESLGHISEPTLPFGLQDTQGNGRTICEHKVALSDELSAAIRAYAKQHEVSPAAIFHAAWALVLGACSNQQEVVFGTVMSGRMNGGAGVERLLGMLINTLPVAVPLQGASVADFVTEVDRRLKALLPYEQVSLAQAQKYSAVGSDGPLFSAMLNYRHTELDETDSDAQESDIQALGAQERTNYPFNLSVNDYGAAHVFSLDLQIDEQVEISRIADYVMTALSTLTDAAHTQPVHALSVLPADEVTRLLTQGQQSLSYDNTACIHQLFEQQAAATPEATALVFQDQFISYETLNLRANQLAHYLLSEQHVTPETLIGVCSSRSLEMIVSMLAILKAGGAYVPLDPDYPASRLSYMAADAGLKQVIGFGSGLSVAEALTREQAGSAIDIATLALDDYPQHNPALDDISSDSLAYVIYTSGSTGQPKGVLTPHRAVQRLVSKPHFMTLDSDTVFLHSANIAFDAATIELWGPLLNGGRCVLYPQDQLDINELNRLIETQGINSMWLTAGLFSEWSHHCDGLTSLRYVLAGGDIVHGADVMRVQQALPQAQVINGYGPTENTTFSCCYAVPTLSESQDIAIGTPLNGDQALVLSDDLSLVPYGSIGELCVGGDGLARGYLNQSELTAERFIDNPFYNPEVAGSARRLYRTGDLVRYLADGNLAFVGRADDQIKIRGFRVELGEIAQQLSRQAEIDSALVLAKNGPAGTYLVAYVQPVDAVAEQAQAAFMSEALATLAQSLPDYMVPKLGVVIAEWPLTANGKVNKKALPEADTSALQGRYVAPENDIERTLCEIWGQLLGLDAGSISTADNFFHLGGHSLLLVRLAAELRAQLAVELPIKTLFNAATIAEQGKAVKAHHGQALRSEVAPVQVARQVDAQFGQCRVLPLSFAQQRLWFIDQLHKGSAQYNMPAAFDVSGTLDLQVVEAVLQTIIDRHEVLKTVYRDGEQGAEQLIRQQAHFTLSVDDVRMHDAAQQQQAIALAMTEQFTQPFDLTRDVMIRAGYIQTADDEGVLLFNMHHIASDGWSMQVLVKEFVQLYQAYSQEQRNPLAPLAIQYADYAQWQRDYLSDTMLEQQLDYWQQQLADVPPVHSLPLDYPRPDIKQHQGACVKSTLSKDVAQGLTALAKAQGLTPFMLLHGALSLLLSRHSNAQEIVIGTPVANRMQAELEPLIGFFVNTLVLNVNTAQSTLADYLAHVKAVHLGAQSNQDVPFEQLVEQLNVPRSTAHTPLFQVMLTTRTDYGVTGDVDDSAWSLGGAQLSPRSDGAVVAKFDLDVNLALSEDGVALCWTYDTALFSEAHIDTLNRHLETLLSTLAQHDRTSLLTQAPGTLTILSEPEQQALLVRANQRLQNYDTALSIHGAFEQQAAATPEATALVFQDQFISYETLNLRANQLAHYLLSEQHVTPETLIGVCSSRSVEMVVSILAILKAGGAYVPLDPDYPASRLSYMAADAGLKQVIGFGSGLAVAEALMREQAGHAIDIATLALDDYPQHNPALEALGGDSLAYVIYTSGSTGQPKGVLTPHRAVQRLVSKPHFMTLDSDTVFLHSANIAFDAATIELWGPLLNGGRCVLYPQDQLDINELNRLIETQGINSMWLTAGLFSEWSHHCDGLTSLRYVLAGGDIVHGADVMRVQQALPQAQVINGYGPTENTTFSCCYAVPTLSESQDIAIGTPLNGDQALVLSDDLSLVPYGSIGELCVGGDGLARGYLNQSELTAERFIDNPFYNPEVAGSARRLYRTGDLVRYLADGNLAFVGRADDQIKIRGFRVELGEIAQQLSRQAEIDSALVLAKNGPAGTYLVAYVQPVDAVAEQAQAAFMSEALATLAQSLPDYMVPKLGVVIAEWPLTANGKVNKKALPEADTSALQGRYVAPENDIEQTLCEIWSQLLGIAAQEISTQSHFFDLGGHSLLVVKLATQVRETFDIEFSIQELYDATRICDQAVHIEYLQLKSNRDDSTEACEELEW